jgi:hypothetical protein
MAVQLNLYPYRFAFEYTNDMYSILDNLYRYGDLATYTIDKEQKFAISLKVIFNENKRDIIKKLYFITFTYGWFIIF